MFESWQCDKCLQQAEKVYSKARENVTMAQAAANRAATTVTRLREAKNARDYAARQREREAAAASAAYREKQAEAGQTWRATAIKLGSQLAQSRGADGSANEIVTRAFKQVDGTNRRELGSLADSIWTTAQGEKIPYGMLETAHVKNIITQGEKIIASLQSQRSLWNNTVRELQKWIGIVNDMNRILASRQ